jgi:hypothetical protein
LKALDWKMLIYFMDILNILRTFGECYDHLVQFVLIWYIFSGFGITHQEKSGNPERDPISKPITSRLLCSRFFFFKSFLQESHSIYFVFRVVRDAKFRYNGKKMFGRKKRDPNVVNYPPKK